MAAIKAVHRRHGQFEQWRRGLEVTGRDGDHRPEDREHIGAAAAPTEDLVEGSLASLHPTGVDEESVQEIRGLVIAPGGHLPSDRAQSDRLIEAALVLRDGSSGHRCAPRGQRVAAPVGVLL